MIDERIVDRRASESADDREGQRGDLLRDHEAEARRNLADELQEDGRASLMIRTQRRSVRLP